MSDFRRCRDDAARYGAGGFERYPPNAAGARIPRAVPDDRIGVGTWDGLGVLLLWTAAALCGGLVTLRRRDM